MNYHRTWGNYYRYQNKETYEKKVLGAGVGLLVLFFAALKVWIETGL